MAPSWLSPNQTGQNSSQPIEWHKESGLSERNSSEDGLENGSLLTKWNKSSNLSELSSIDDQYTSLATIGLCDAVIIGTAMGVSLHIGGHDKSAFVGVLIDAVAGFVSMAASGMLSAKSEEHQYQRRLDHTRNLVQSDRETATGLVKTTFRSFGNMEETDVDKLIRYMDSSDLEDAIMRFVHLEDKSRYTRRRPYIAGIVLALSSLIGGLLPIVSWWADSSNPAVLACLIGGATLFGFGCLEQYVSGQRKVSHVLCGGLTVVIFGGVATAVSVGVAVLFKDSEVEIQNSNNNNN